MPAGSKASTLQTSGKRKGSPKNRQCDEIFMFGEKERSLAKMTPTRDPKEAQKMTVWIAKRNSLDERKALATRQELAWDMNDDAEGWGGRASTGDRELQGTVLAQAIVERLRGRTVGRQGD